MSDVAVPITRTDLGLFVEQARQVHQIAQALADTAFVPASMRGKPQEITGAILFGRELGMDPMTALQTVNIIQGRPTLTANAMRGLAMAAGVQFKLQEATQTRCVMSAIAPGQRDWTTVTWTIDQAQRLDLLKKDNWKNQPGAMLIARATSQLCRLVAANILIGSPYSTEEVKDLPQVTTADEVKQIRAEKAKPKSTNPHKYDEPELVPDNAVPEFATGNANIPAKEIGYSTVDDEKRIAPEEPIDREGKISTKTRSALMAAFADANVKDRNVRNATVSKILNREVHTVNNLTEAEGQSVLAVLQLDPEWPEVAKVQQT
jgi:hypothetical protein